MPSNEDNVRASTQAQNTGQEPASWSRNNWTEEHTREIMQILVDEFIANNNFATGAYSKTLAPDARFEGKLSFNRESRELYNKVQNLRQRFYTPHGYLLHWDSGHSKKDKAWKKAEKGLLNQKTRESLHGIFASGIPRDEIITRLSQTLDSDGSSSKGQDNGTPAMAHALILETTAANGAATETASVRSVNYYRDTFRGTAPDIWASSVEAYRRFLSHRDIQAKIAAAVAAAKNKDNRDDSLSITTMAEADDGRPAKRRKSVARKDGGGGATTTKNAATTMAANPLSGDNGAANSSNSSSGCLNAAPPSMSPLVSHTPSSSMGGHPVFGTPSSSSLLTDLGSGFNSDGTIGDDGSPEHMVMSVTGQAWHMSLLNHNRWKVLGLSYKDVDDCVVQETTFLVQRFMKLVPESASCYNNSLTEIPLTVVPAYNGSFDETSIETAIGRSNKYHVVRPSHLLVDLLPHLQKIKRSNNCTVVSLCRLTDRITRTAYALALLVIHGDNIQNFGLFPHEDQAFTRQTAERMSLWYQCSSANRVTQSTPQLDNPDLSLFGSNEGEEASSANKSMAAFSYQYGGFRYSFFARTEADCFQMARTSDSVWPPTISPAFPVEAGEVLPLTKDSFLRILQLDTTKTVERMVELFRLRLFCFGHYDGIAPVNISSSTAASVRRRASERLRRATGGSALPQRHSRGNQSISRISRGPQQQSAFNIVAPPATDSSNVPYLRPQSLSSMQSIGNGVGFLTPDLPNLDPAADSSALFSHLAYFTPQLNNCNMAPDTFSVPCSPYMNGFLDNPAAAAAGNGNGDMAAAQLAALTAANLAATTTPSWAPLNNAAAAATVSTDSAATPFFPPLSEAELAAAPDAVAISSGTTAGGGGGFNVASNLVNLAAPASNTTPYINISLDGEGGQLPPPGSSNLSVPLDIPSLLASSMQSPAMAAMPTAVVDEASDLVNRVSIENNSDMMANIRSYPQDSSNNSGGLSMSALGITTGTSLDNFLQQSDIAIGSYFGRPPPTITPSTTQSSISHSSSQETAAAKPQQQKETELQTMKSPEHLTTSSGC